MANLFQSAFEIQRHLERAQIRSALIGGLAVAIWGEPRLTADVDLKVLLERDRAEELISQLQPRYSCLASDPKDAIERMGLLFVKDKEGIRIDLLLTDTLFDVDVINGAKPIEIDPSISLVVCRPEDLIIYKMISTRPRDREDVRGIILRQKDALDNQYILNWLTQFEQALDDSTLIIDYRQMCGF